MDLITLFLGGVEQRHPKERGVFGYGLTRSKLQTAAIAYDDYPPAHCKSFKVTLEIHICKHFDDNLNAFVIREIMDISKVVLVRVIKNGIYSLLLYELFAIVRARRSDDPAAGIFCPLCRRDPDSARRSMDEDRFADNCGGLLKKSSIRRRIRCPDPSTLFKAYIIGQSTKVFFTTKRVFGICSCY